MCLFSSYVQGGKSYVLSIHIIDLIPQVITFVFVQHFEHFNVFLQPPCLGKHSLLLVIITSILRCLQFTLA